MAASTSEARTLIHSGRSVTGGRRTRSRMLNLELCCREDLSPARWAKGGLRRVNAFKLIFGRAAVPGRRQPEAGTEARPTKIHRCPGGTPVPPNARGDPAGRPYDKRLVGRPLRPATSLLFSPYGDWERGFGGVFRKCKGRRPLALSPKVFFSLAPSPTIFYPSPSTPLSALPRPRPRPPRWRRTRRRGLGVRDWGGRGGSCSRSVRSSSSASGASLI